MRFGAKEDGKWVDSGGVWEAKIADAPEKLADGGVRFTLSR